MDEEKINDSIVSSALDSNQNCEAPNVKRCNINIDVNLEAGNSNCFGNKRPRCENDNAAASNTTVPINEDLVQQLKNDLDDNQLAETSTSLNTETSMNELSSTSSSNEITISENNPMAAVGNEILEDIGNIQQEIDAMASVIFDEIVNDELTSDSSDSSHIFPDISDDHVSGITTDSISDSDSDSDSDSSSINMGPSREVIRQTAETTKNEILAKEKPSYNWISMRELYYREMGLSPPRTNRNKTVPGKLSSIRTKHTNKNFENFIYSSFNIVERMKIIHTLDQHRGCVNSLNFNSAGTLLVSGSDDLKNIIWDWANKRVRYKYSSGHSSNVFQTKFLNTGSCGMDIVSSARDGKVLHAVVPSSGGAPHINLLVKHSGAVQKISLPVSSPYEVLSAGEDGKVIRCDLRTRENETLLQVKNMRQKVPLYSIHTHPYDPQFCVCGRDQFVRVYDRRNLNEPVWKMAPEHLLKKRIWSTNVTNAIYNHDGTEILASYSEDDIFLFNNVQHQEGKYLHKYEGHKNVATVKSVSFFGPNSEYVISGSDCSFCFFWDKETESIVNFVHGDRKGVVNCLEPHPSFPILATSGIEPDVKIWSPESRDPDATASISEVNKKANLGNVIAKNLRNRNHTANVMNDVDAVSSFIRHCLIAPRQRARLLHQLVGDSESSNDEDFVVEESDNESIIDYDLEFGGDDDEDDDADNDDDADGGRRFNSLPCQPS